MELFQTLLMLLAIIAFAITIVVAPIACFRCIKNMFIVVEQTKPDARERYPSLNRNIFNSLIYYDVLNEKGKIARKQVFKSLLIFCGSIFFTLTLWRFSAFT